MENPFKKLLEPGQIGNLKIKNRMVMAPMRTNLPGPEGEVTPRLIEYYRRRATGGVGLITVEGSYIMNDHGVGAAPKINLGLFKDTFIPELGELVDAVHEAGAKIAIQALHSGRQAGYHSPVSISDIPCGELKKPVRKLSVSELNEIEDGFAAASLVAKQAGFDAFQFHFCNGTLPAISLSPKFNNRTDIYGGNFENRLRLCLNIIEKSKKKVGADYPLFCRLPTQEFVEGGLTVEDIKLISKELEKAGLVAIDLNSGVHESHVHCVPPACMPRGFAADLARDIKNAINIPVMIAGRINDPYLAEEILKSGKSDFISLGRVLISDPDFPLKVMEGRPEDIRKCIACSVCHRRMRSGLHIRCTFSATAGRELEYQDEFPSLTHGKKKVVVVGGGPAGLEAAYVLAKRGHEVTQFEKTKEFGGEQLAIAKVPPHKQELANISEYYQNQLSIMDNWKFHLGKEASPRTIEDLSPDVVIMATGSNPVIPNIPGAEKAYTAREVLKGTVSVGKTVAVVGGNAIGCETAEWLAAKNKKVTLVEMLDEVASDIEPATKYALLQRLSDDGVKIITGKKVVGVVEKGALCLDKKWQESIIKADTVIFATGAVSQNELFEKIQKKVKKVFVIGDANEPGQIINALSDAYRIARSI
jgi:2,4-dienoyl-CoA reductase-like NADH-dependent reductase (Old Yellow Enzyme family)/thioredoxin reductase